LTPHFTLAELTVTNHRTLDNTPDPAALANLQRLAEFMEKVKELLWFKPIMITSAYRSKAVNDAVGSKNTSQHRIGCAADFRVPGMTPREVVDACIKGGLPFDQIILEFDAWTHISVPNVAGVAPRGSKLIIDKQGTRPF
jgi:zinc D-Ala-D-Ala carboxypeptidase